jgi:carbon storage regulator CsrA
MLVLSRKLQQQIKIGDQITVTILRVKGNTVRVGIQAPRDVRVIRGELPKADETANATDLVDSQTLIAIPAEDCAEQSEAADEPSDLQRVSSTPSPANSTSQIPTAHLPLRRIRERHGRGPLKHLIAAATHTLAK